MIAGIVVLRGGRFDPGRILVHHNQFDGFRFDFDVFFVFQGGLTEGGQFVTGVNVLPVGIDKGFDPMNCL